MTGDTEIVISGHTHIFACEFKNNTLFLNPGEVCAREKPLSECVMLEVTPKEFQVKYFTNLQLEKSFTFQRG
jgi:predicted phosphodiesterase